MKTVLALAVLFVAFQQPGTTQTAEFTRVYPLKSPGLVAPVVVSKSQPVYTDEAMRAKVEGTLVLDVTIGSDGHVRDALVTKPLDAGLDEAAVAAMSAWTFTPATLEGRPVATRVTIDFAFRLH